MLNEGRVIENKRLLLVYKRVTAMYLNSLSFLVLLIVLYRLLQLFQEIWYTYIYSFESSGFY